MIISHSSILRENVEAICRQKVNEGCLSPSDATAVISWVNREFAREPGSSRADTPDCKTIRKLAAFFEVAPSEVDPHYDVRFISPML